MLKKDFFSAIENLLKAGFQPRFYTVNSGRIGLITFTDKNGTKQVEQGIGSINHLFAPHPKYLT
ncbi:hypothetical protein OI980_26395 (plasmid) [Enterobacter roggenkampii]|nr:hypothetical protein [Enterobacter roggenkampii]WIJ81484.1 hypothetical protein OI980_26395 [Enterobacter roggenkampii]